MIGMMTPIATSSLQPPIGTSSVQVQCADAGGGIPPLAPRRASHESLTKLYNASNGSPRKPEELRHPDYYVASGNDVVTSLAETLEADRKSVVQLMENQHYELLRNLARKSAHSVFECSVLFNELPEAKGCSEQILVRDPDHSSGNLIVELPHPLCDRESHTTACHASPPTSEHEEELDICASERDICPSEKTPTSPRRPSEKRRSVSKASNSTLESEWALKRANAKGLMIPLLHLQCAINSNQFEVVLACLIVLNALTMAIEAQYISFDTAYKLGWKDADSPAEELWPGGELCLFLLEMFFGVVFTFEVIAKVAVGPCLFIRSAWNGFDTIIVMFWVLSVFNIELITGNVMLLRLMRLVRLLRLVRLVKTIQLFDVLSLLIRSLQASGRVLFWAQVLLTFLMLAFGLVFNFLLEPFILDKGNPEQARMEVFARFGSFSRSFLTMLEMTLGNWVPPSRILVEHVSEWYLLALVAYVCVVNFAVIQVVRSVFTCETFNVASTDVDVMIMQQERQIQRHADNMAILFADADASGDGYINFEEFQNIVSDPRVQAWLSAMEFDVHDARHVFELLDDGDQKLSALELAQGIRRLKGTARSIDMISLLSVCRRVERALVHMAAGREVEFKTGLHRFVTPVNP